MQDLEVLEVCVFGVCIELDAGHRDVIYNQSLLVSLKGRKVCGTANKTHRICCRRLDIVQRWSFVSTGLPDGSTPLLDARSRGDRGGERSVPGATLFDFCDVELQQVVQPGYEFLSVGEEVLVVIASAHCLPVSGAWQVREREKRDRGAGDGCRTWTLPSWATVRVNEEMKNSGGVLCYTNVGWWWRWTTVWWC